MRQVGLLTIHNLLRPVLVAFLEKLGKKPQRPALLDSANNLPALADDPPDVAGHAVSGGNNSDAWREQIEEAKTTVSRLASYPEAFLRTRFLALTRINRIAVKLMGAMLGAGGKAWDWDAVRDQEPPLRILDATKGEQTNTFWYQIESHLLFSTEWLPIPAGDRSYHLGSSIYGAIMRLAGSVWTSIIRPCEQYPAKLFTILLVAPDQQMHCATAVFTCLPPPAGSIQQTVP